jgi:hypothetical protein
MNKADTTAAHFRQRAANNQKLHTYAANVHIVGAPTRVQTDQLPYVLEAAWLASKCVIFLTTN